MTATSVKKADSILAEMARVQSEMARLKAQTTRALAELNTRHEELRLELEGLYAIPVETLAGPQITPRLAPVAGHKVPSWAGRPEDENLLLRAVGNLKRWCAQGTPEHPRPSYAAAKSWTTHGAHGRPIPRRWANYFKENHGIPLEWWPHGLTEGHEEKPRRRGRPRKPRTVMSGM